MSETTEPTAPKQGSVPSFEPPTRSSVQLVHEALSGSIEQWKVNAAAEKVAREAAEAQAKKALEDSATAVRAATDAANDRIIRVELRAAAIAAGIVDIDALALLDRSSVKLNDAGEVIGAAEAIAAMKAAKPWAFQASGQQTGTTSTSAKAPLSGDPKPKRATEMSVDEWKVAKAELMKRR